MTSSTECFRLRTSLGVYVLGAIEPAERAELDEHLRGCKRCRDELASLAGLPAMLSRVIEKQILELGPPREELLESIITKANRETRTRRRRNTIWLAAAGVLLMVATGTGVGLVAHESGRSALKQSPVPSTAPSTTPGAATPRVIRELSATDRATGVLARVTMQSRRWGTAFDVRVTGAPAGMRCRLVAIDKNGNKDIAGGWVVPINAHGGTGEYYGSSMIMSDRLASIEVRTIDGKRLVRIPV